MFVSAKGPWSHETRSDSLTAMPHKLGHPVPTNERTGAEPTNFEVLGTRTMPYWLNPPVRMAAISFNLFRHINLPWPVGPF